MIYKTSLDNLAKVVTACVTLLFVVIIIAQLSAIKDSRSIFPIITIVFLFLIYIGTFLYRPINYMLTDDKLIIHRPLNSIKIDRVEINKIEQLDQSKLKGTIRTFGVGGLFGYWGRFYNKQIGSMIWYATRRDKAVLITTISNKKIVLTPDDPEKLLSSFN